jgi:hypothetical protein
MKGNTRQASPIWDAPCKCFGILVKGGPGRDGGIAKTAEIAKTARSKDAGGAICLLSAMPVGGQERQAMQSAGDEGAGGLLQA